MAFELSYIMDIDREKGQPLWWKTLIEAHTRRGYEVRFLNYFYTYKNETIDTSDRLEFWDRNEFSYYIKQLQSSLEVNKKEAQNFFKKNIIFFLSRIDGIYMDNIDISFDNEKRNIIVSFDVELIDKDRDNIKLFISY